MAEFYETETFERRGMSSEDDRSRRRGRGQRLADQDNQNLALFVYQEMKAGEHWEGVGVGV